MSKFTDAVKAGLKAYFETGDTPSQTQYEEWLDAIQNGIQEHQHLATGGAEAGTGDAGAATNLQSGEDASKSATPAVGDYYLATDTGKVYRCLTAEAWTVLFAWSTPTFCIPGALEAGSNVAPSILATDPMTIDKVYLYVRTAPTGASLIADVDKNAVTIFTEQANRPEIAIAAHVAESGTPDIVALAKNDRLDAHLDQVGSTEAGADLSIFVRCKQDVTL